MPQETKSSKPHESDAAQGYVAEGDDPPALHHAIALAVDYRGDVTITRRSDETPLECFVFDQTKPNDPANSVVRAFPKNADQRMEIPVSDIARLEFTGRDTAAGKSFDTWMKKYVEKKLAGEKASIESENLDD